MIIKVRQSSDIAESDVTDENVYRNRRKLLKGLGFLGASALLAPATSRAGWFDDDPVPFETRDLTFTQSQQFTTDEKLTPKTKATSYNNFYEFGTDKGDPVLKAQGFKVEPWTLQVDGLVENPLTLDYDTLYKRYPLEQRIYRLRCVEAWSMVIPWVGFPLADLIKQANPLSSARYVAFETLYDPEQMPGQRNRFVGGGINYPYVEGLRLDEASHPLTMLAVGMYGRTLPPQNGAPIRLVVPWKYGFKSIKSIVRIRLTDKMPPTTWNILAPHEYGFYANVNPKVAHPRWSQARERRLTDGGLLAKNRIDTLMFNGYDEVAPLYKGMDLTRNY